MIIRNTPDEIAQVPNTDDSTLNCPFCRVACPDSAHRRSKSRQTVKRPFQISTTCTTRKRRENEPQWNRSEEYSSLDHQPGNSQPAIWSSANSTTMVRNKRETRKSSIATYPNKQIPPAFPLTYTMSPRQPLQATSIVQLHASCTQLDHAVCASAHLSRTDHSHISCQSLSSPEPRIRQR